MVKKITKTTTQISIRELVDKFSDEIVGQVVQVHLPKKHDKDDILDREIKIVSEQTNNDYGCGENG